MRSVVLLLVLTTALIGPRQVRSEEVEESVFHFIPVAHFVSPAVDYGLRYEHYLEQFQRGSFEYDDVARSPAIYPEATTIDCRKTEGIGVLFLVGVDAANIFLPESPVKLDTLAASVSVRFDAGDTSYDATRLREEWVHSGLETSSRRYPGRRLPFAIFREACMDYPSPNAALTIKPCRFKAGVRNITPFFAFDRSLADMPDRFGMFYLVLRGKDRMEGETLSLTISYRDEPLYTGSFRFENCRK